MESNTRTILATVTWRTRDSVVRLELPVYPHFEGWDAAVPA